MDQLQNLSFDNTEIAFAYKTDKELRRATLIFSAMRYHWLVKAGTRIAAKTLQWGLPVRAMIRDTVFDQFCGGESLEEAARTAARLGCYNVNVILDYGVEAAEGEENYDRAVSEFIRAIEFISQQPGVPFVSLKITGLGRFELLEKINQDIALTQSEEDEWNRIRKRIYDICEAASKNKKGVLIDAEESWIQRSVDIIAEKMMQQFNSSVPVIYNTFQLYRHDRLAFLKEAYEKSRRQGYILGAKLVRGAYMEKERQRALSLGYASPIQPNKAGTDHDYNEALKICIKHLDGIATLIGTHNEQSCMLGARLLHNSGISHAHPHVHFSQLFGMSDHITFNLAKAGYRVSKYLPYGPVKEVLPYLIRRAEENSSVSGQAGREIILLRRELQRRKREESKK